MTNFVPVSTCEVGAAFQSGSSFSPKKGGSGLATPQQIIPDPLVLTGLPEEWKELIEREPNFMQYQVKARIFKNINNTGYLPYFRVGLFILRIKFSLILID